MPETENTPLTGAEQSTPQSEKAKPKVWIPNNPVELSATAKRAQKSWKDSGLTVIWTTPDELGNDIVQFDADLNGDSTTRADLNPVTARINELDAIAATHLSYIKNYISNEYGKRNAPSYYSQFGVEKVKGSYKFPKTRELRLIAYDRTVDALITHKLDQNKYGVAFWKPIADEYRELLQTSGTTTTTTYKHLSNKNILKAKVRKTLRAIMDLIKANYPDTYENEYRIWGFGR